MRKDFASWKRYSQIAGLIAIFAILTCNPEPVRAAVINSCTDCHGMPSRDAARKANPRFRSLSSAFIGNHKNHLPAIPVAGDCSICHPPVSATDFSHHNDKIEMVQKLKGYSTSTGRARYDKGLFFNLTSIPNLVNATCSNVNCHFERKTAAWGSAPYVAPADCAACHGAPPTGGATGTAGSHPRHETYYPGISNCQKCHPVHATFIHATSAGRPLKVQGFLRTPLNTIETSGTYSGSGANYLPSKSASQIFGSCNTIYCHSAGQSTTGSSTGITYRTVPWGGTALTCGGCHLDMATDATGTGNHRIHTISTGANYDCAACHINYTRTTAPAGTHANSMIELGATGFTYSQGSGATHPAGNSFGTCSASACHGSGSVTWGATFVAPGNSFPYSASQCDKCHSGSATAPFYSTAAPAKVTATTDVKVGAHTSHLTTPDALASVIACADCHGTVALNSATHMNGTTNFTWSSLATRSGALTPTFTVATRVCANVYCHGASMPGGDTTGTNRAPVWNVAFLSATLSRAACAACHGFPPPAASGHPVVTIPASWPAVGAATGALGTTCNCHANISTTGTTYANIFVNRALHINGIFEPAASGHAVPFYAHATPPYTACTGCHNATTAGVYPAAAGAAPNCRGCHLTADPSVTTTGCTSCHANPPNGAVRPNVVGSHVKHNAIACATCHNGAGAGSGASHGPGNSGANPAVDNVIFTAAQAGASATWTAATKTCSTTYCHGATLTGGTNKSPVWGTTLTGCALCHGNPPATTTHAGVTSTQCITCHVHVNSTGNGFTNAALHLNGVIEATGGTCIGCHATVQTGTHGTPRGAVMSEFTLAWGHKKTGRAAVTDADCIVCHLEGEFATQKTSATKHMDGNVDLRDPDGVGEAPITNISGTAFTFKRFSTSYVAGSRTATGHTSNTDIANVISLKFCIKCHDANGATNITARSGTAPTQYLPFGTGSQNGAAYTVGLSAGVVGGVVDVDTMFSVTNSTYHPVKGPQNNRYASGTRMAVPYGVTKSAVANGIVMNCFDCHNSPAPRTTRTVAAHGSTAPNAYRGTVYDTTNTLCHVCHTGYLVPSGNAHGTGSAFNSSIDSGMNTYLRNQCQRCHASTNTAVRPVRAEDAHGFNRFAGTGTDAMWPRGTTETYRPYAFMRNATQWTTTSWKPLSGPGVPIGSATCGGSMSASGCGDNMTTYSPGGTF